MILLDGELVKCRSENGYNNVQFCVWYLVAFGNHSYAKTIKFAKRRQLAEMVVSVLKHNASSGGSCFIAMKDMVRVSEFETNMLDRINDPFNNSPYFKHTYSMHGAIYDIDGLVMYDPESLYSQGPLKIKWNPSLDLSVGQFYYQDGEVTLGALFPFVPATDRVRNRNNSQLNRLNEVAVFDIGFVENKGMTKHIQKLGKGFLMTNREDLTPQEVVWTYRQQYLVEQAFKWLKSGEFLTIRPMFHRIDNSVRGHIFTCYIGLLLLSLLVKELIRLDIPTSIYKTVKHLKEIRLTRIYMGDHTKPLVTIDSMSDDAKKIYDSLELKSYL